MPLDIRGSEVPLDDEGRVYHLGVGAGDVAKHVFLVGDPARSHLVAKRFDKVSFKTENREFITYTGEFRRVPVSVISTGIGTDNTEIALVELHILNEYDHATASWRREYKPLTVIRLGSSGSPQPDVKLGSLAITSYAIGLDNTGTYYPSRRQDEVITRLTDQIYSSDLRYARPYLSKAHPDVVEALAKAAKRLGLEFYVGITSSASGFYGPQGRQVGRLAEILIPDLQAILADIRVKEGPLEIRVVNNEMESSLLNRICEILDYRSGSVCAILAKRKTGEFLDSISYRRSIMNCIQVGLEAMVELYEATA